MRTTAIPTLALLCLLTACHANDPAIRDPGNPPPMEFPSVDGQTMRPLDAPRGVRAVVLIFIATDCPVSNAYAPETNRNIDEYGRKGVAFRLVYAEPTTKAADAGTHLKEYGYHAPALLDHDQRLVRLTGASATPTAVIFLPDQHWVYRGRIDDRYVDFGKSRPDPTRRDLRDALDAVLSGKPVSTATTEVIGCPI